MTLVVCNFQTLFEILNYAIHVNFIFSVFFGPMFSLKGPQGLNTGPLVVRGPQFEKRWPSSFAAYVIPDYTTIK